MFKAIRFSKQNPKLARNHGFATVLVRQENKPWRILAAWREGSKTMIIVQEWFCSDTRYSEEKNKLATQAY